MPSEDNKAQNNFIQNLVSKDVELNKNKGAVMTRFPPEPNGYLHIGHAKSICLNFGIAQRFNGRCNLRFDDTNPEKEDVEYINSIKDDIRWLGFEWAELRFASEYFDALYEKAIELIKLGKAYVDSQSNEQIRETRGTLTEAGTLSPYRNRSIEENLDLFTRMKQGEFQDGEHVLRAKIDMASPNINLRDPIIYRVRHAHHHQTGNKWCIYPMYDYTHCLSDSFENITHSLCTLEFEDHRPLYDWVLDELSMPSHPQQIEFARLSLEYTIMSKRKLTQLVSEKHVTGWNDPRMLTISGLKRRGYTPASIRNFCERIGITKKNSSIEMSVLENAIREDLESIALRVMGVLKPLRMIITSYPEGKTETLEAQNHPQDPAMGVREIPFCNEIFIEHDDFMEDAPKKFFRLSVGKEVRLRHAYIVKCEKVIKNDQGEIIEIHCSHDPNTLGKNPEDRKVKGVIHWVSAKHAIDANINLYDRLFNVPNPASEDNFIEHINPDSLIQLNNCKIEPSLEKATIGQRYQFERQGYFCLDPDSDKNNILTFNRTTTLRDSWAKQKG